MPAYGKPPYAISVYPGENGLAVGRPAIPDGPAALQNVQAETISNGFKSIPICVAVPGNRGYTQRQIVWRTSYPTPPISVAITLEGSMNDVEGEYVSVDSSTNVNGETKTTAVTGFRFFRVHCTAIDSSALGIVELTCM